jgi:hypothetical protein
MDDLDGGEAADTIRFGLDGTEYENDLSAAHSDELRQALGHYLAHARRTGWHGQERGPRPGTSTAVHTAKVREWARAGHRGQEPRPCLRTLMPLTGSDDRRGAAVAPGAFLRNTSRRSDVIVSLNWTFCTSCTIQWCDCS